MRYAYLFAGLLVLIVACLCWSLRDTPDDPQGLDGFEERERQFQQDQHTEYME